MDSNELPNLTSKHHLSSSAKTFPQMCRSMKSQLRIQSTELMHSETNSDEISHILLSISLFITNH
jgi:hypothetical protein